MNEDSTVVRPATLNDIVSAFGSVLVFQDWEGMARLRSMPTEREDDRKGACCIGTCIMTWCHVKGMNLFRQFMQNCADLCSLSW